MELYCISLEGLRGTDQKEKLIKIHDQLIITYQDSTNFKKWKENTQH